MQWKNSPSEYKYNIFWSEMSTPTKLAHIVKQMFIFLILPLVVLATTFNRCLYSKWPMDACFPCSYFIRESQIPVNRFQLFTSQFHEFTISQIYYFQSLLFHKFTILRIIYFTNLLFHELIISRIYYFTNLPIHKFCFSILNG